MNMTRNEINWNVLNAYVDGLLDRDMSANVAAAAASDPDLAARIATLSKLKASTPKRACIPEDDVPPFPEFSGKESFTRRRMAGLAAAVLVVLAIGAAAGLWPQNAPRDGDWLRDAVAAQKQWLASTSSYNGDDASLLRVDAAKAARPLDLSDADLKLIYVATSKPAGSAETMFLGYRGPHGCMVGLWIGHPQANIETLPRKLDTGSILVRAWKDQNTGYALLSKGMDPARLDRLADAVSRLTDPRHTVDDEIHTALRDVKRTGAACRV